MSIHTRRTRLSVRPDSSILTKFRHSLTVGLILLGAQCAVPQFLYAAELREIQQRGYVIVAVKDNLRPLGFRNSAGQLEGLEIDLAHRLAAELLGRPDAVRFQPVANQERLSVLMEGDVDIVIAHLSTTPSRARLVDFSDYYYLDGTAIVTNAPFVQRLADLRRQTVAVLEGSSTIAVVRSRLPSARFVGVKSYLEAKQLLDSGQATAFAADASVLAGWVQEYPEYRVLPDLLSGEALGVAMPRGNQYRDLRQRVNDAIRRLQQEGWLRERILHWGLPYSSTDS